ncbi:MAG: cytochrome c [Pirellula sp.]|nr:cytochrome c [Pirellula sp.]
MFFDFQHSYNRYLHAHLWLFPVVLGLVLCGCSSEKIEFRSNELHAASLSMESTPLEIRRLADRAKDATEVLLGTADLPTWPASVLPPLDIEKVVRSSGPVGRDKSKVESGLFRKHCVQCHGISGDGRGPAAALLAPYPRDFRRGSFKFKSTPIGKKPTHSDIVRTLEQGLPGTAMPAFGTLSDSEEFADDVDALAHYVRFLAIRGEVERRLLVALSEQDIDESASLEILTRVANDWMAAESHCVKRPELVANPNHDERMKSVSKGKALFESELTACVKCHGGDGSGTGTSQDFDDWTKDWTIRAGIDPANKSEWKAMKKYGALKPVIDRPRNLTLGALRGGTSRGDIYLRLVLGIEGSPMLAVAKKENGNPGLTDDDIRDLVEYVHSLSDGARNTSSRQEVDHAASE